MVSPPVAVMFILSAAPASKLPAVVILISLCALADASGRFNVNIPLGPLQDSNTRL